MKYEIFYLPTSTIFPTNNYQFPVSELHIYCYRRYVFPFNINIHPEQISPPISLIPQFLQSFSVKTCLIRRSSILLHASFIRHPHPPTISGQAENVPNYLHLPYTSRRNPTRPQFLHKPPSKVLQKFRDGEKRRSKIAKISWTVITIPTRRRRNKDY